MIIKELEKLYGDYENNFKEKEFLTDKLIMDDFNKLGNEIKSVIIGEAPGRDEYEQGIPFIGQAGKNLRNNLVTDNIWITNTIKFRPVFRNENGELELSKNRTPTIQEIRTSIDYLRQELELLQTYNKVDSILILGLTGLTAINEILRLYKSLGYSYKILDSFGREITRILNSGIEEVINQKFTIFIYSEEGENIFSWDLFVTYHPSPLNYNIPHKKQKFLEGLSLYAKSFILN